MVKLELMTLQMPRLLLNGYQIIFPYKKPEALFYYIAIEKTSTRDIVASLLWEDSSTETARKNLRHALYVLKKTFGFDVIISSQKSTLKINPEIEFHCDVDDLLNNNDISVYKGEFLLNFFVKNSTMYDEWLVWKREKIRNIYLIELYNHIISLPKDRISEIELVYNDYIAIDPYDERVSIALIKAYLSNKLYLKGIKVYEKLHKDLNEELGIVPGHEITQLYRQLRKEWAEISSIETDVHIPVIQGRAKEVSELNNAFQLFLNGSVHSILIDGENGIGKTFLIQNVLSSLEDDDIYKMQASCFSPEKKTPLYPWNTLIFQFEECILKNNISIPHAYSQVVSQFFPTFLGQPTVVPTLPLDIENNFNFKAVQNGIFRILSLICEHVPVVINIENFHFSDIYSRQLLTVLLRQCHKNLMVILTSLDTLNDDMTEFISFLKKEELLTQIHLNRFSKEDTREIVTSTLGNTLIDEKTLDIIYKETAGNAFFLNELLTTYNVKGELSSLSSNAKDILAERLHGLSLESKQLLDIISLFHDYSTLDILEIILGKNSLEILDNIEELKVRSLIKERVSQDIIQLYFTHAKMQEFIQSRISPSKQKVLHNSIGYALEHKLTNKKQNLYIQLVHHFSLGGNSTKVIQYKIYPFEDISVNMFELYPSLFNSLDPINTENLSEYFITLERDLEQSKDFFDDENLYENLYARLLIAKGRYCILSGLYCDGVISIKKSLQMPYVQNSSTHMLKSLRLMIYHSIQLYNLDMMKEYVTKGLTLAKDCKNWLELALFNRLEGLRYLMLNEFKESEIKLQQSISILNGHNINNITRIINIAAANNYLGDMYRKQKQFDKAIINYQTAINLCVEYNINSNATFYNNLACAFLGKGNRSVAYDNFFIASNLYDNSFTLMGRSITSGYCAIALCEKGDFQQAKSYLIKAENSVKQLSSPLEKGLFRRTQAELLFRYSDELSDVLKEGLKFYYEDCKRLLKPLGAYEVEDVELYFKHK
jgi:DNA-binding SARP family transcriptional activator